jgi:hypothetical protein
VVGPASPLGSDWGYGKRLASPHAAWRRSVSKAEGRKLESMADGIARSRYASTDITHRQTRCFYY